MTSTKIIEKGTISICFVHEALECVRSRGLDQNGLLLNAGISPELLAFPQARVSPRQYGILWHLIAQALDDEFFGMDSHPMKTGSFTLLCHAIIQSDNLERALRRTLRFLGLILHDLVGELHREGDTAHIVLKDLSGIKTASSSISSEPKRAFAYGTYLIILHGLACWLVGRRIPISQANFRCAEPRFSEEWRVLFSQNLNFQHDHSGISFPASYLDMSNIQNERTMKEFLRTAPANFLIKYKNSDNYSAKVRRSLREWPPAAWPDFNTLAHQFHTSAATLRRRLGDEGESYRSIMEGLRRDIAISMLSETQLSISDITDKLGYAEKGAFCRAFKKWTGTRPSEYRKNNVENVADSLSDL